jgi:hypothetical protein
MRVAVVGPRTWFANHYPEGWEQDPLVLCLDVFEGDYSWLMVLRNWRPDVTLFYRPELYPARYLHHIPGQRIAFLTEPLPALRDGRLEMTAESALRLAVYQGMSWGAYHRCLYYDAGRKASVEQLGWPISGYRPLPIDTSHFRPGAPDDARPIDICFVGKATPHRIALLDFLRSTSMRFLWVAHGVSGAELAALFRRSRVVLNVHADGVAAQEPRLYLAAACGCRVLTEPLSTAPAAFRASIIELAGPWTEGTMRAELGAAARTVWTEADEAERRSLSVRRLLAEEAPGSHCAHTERPALPEADTSLARLLA